MMMSPLWWKQKTPLQTKKKNQSHIASSKQHHHQGKKEIMLIQQEECALEEAFVDCIMPTAATGSFGH
jgi:hypothetical protein